MATFSLDGSDFERLDWQLLQNGSVSLYFRREKLESDLEWLWAHRYRLEDFDCATWVKEDGMHRAFAATLRFPEYYGMNLSALSDCMTDIEVPAEGGLVLVLRRFDAFASSRREVAQRVLDVLADSARRFLLFGRRLLVLVQSDDPRISFEPVGATAVGWNPREWLNKDRGL